MSNVPTKLKGTEFEDLLIKSSDREEKNGALTMKKYPVTYSLQDGKMIGIPSRPDFEGVLATGRQFIIEAKVCGEASFPMVKQQLKQKQIQHMLDRSRFNVPCFLLIHFTARVMRTFTDPATTIAIPVSDADPRWQRFVDALAEAKRQTKLQGKPVVPEPQGSISRDEAHQIGIIIPWITSKGCRKPLPDLLAFLWPSARQTQLSVCRVADPEASAVDKCLSKPADSLPIWDAGEEAAEELFSNADVDLPDTAAQDSASKTNSPAVSG